MVGAPLLHSIFLISFYSKGTFELIGVSLKIINIKVYNDSDSVEIILILQMK